MKYKKLKIQKNKIHLQKQNIHENIKFKYKINQNFRWQKK